ncbi:MAG: hypothetical protein AAF502_08070 [Bacteroidota bacterium]
MSDQLFYVSPSKPSWSNLFIAVLIVIIPALLLGYIYALLTFINPILYINFLMTVGAGLLLGLLARFVIRLVKIRNRKSKYLLTGILVLLFHFFQWSGFMLFAISDGYMGIGPFLSFLPVCLNPVFFFGIIAELFQTGYWVIFGGTIKGFVALLVWTAELAIAGGLAFQAVVMTKDYPYSEDLARWYPKFTLDNQFRSVVGSDAFIEKLNADLIGTLDEIAEGIAYKYALVHIFFLPYEKVQYLSFENVFIEGRGRGKTNSSLPINNLKISTEDAKMLMQKFGAKQERIDVI